MAYHRRTNCSSSAAVTCSLRPLKYTMYAKFTAFWLLIKSLVMKPAERRIIVMRSKCVSLINARMPLLSF